MVCNADLWNFLNVIRNTGKWEVFINELLGLHKATETFVVVSTGSDEEVLREVLFLII